MPARIVRAGISFIPLEPGCISVRALFRFYIRPELELNDHDADIDAGANGL
jgi:hypothetical protein